MNPTHRLGCPACGETWAGVLSEVDRAARCERAIETQRKRDERKAKEDALRARLAAAPKVGGR
jgi:hypothetical protein